MVFDALPAPPDELVEFDELLAPVELVAFDILLAPVVVFDVLLAPVALLELPTTPVALLELPTAPVEFVELLIFEAYSLLLPEVAFPAEEFVAFPLETLDDALPEEPFVEFKNATSSLTIVPPPASRKAPKLSIQSSRSVMLKLDKFYGPANHSS